MQPPGLVVPARVGQQLLEGHVAAAADVPALGQEVRLREGRLLVVGVHPPFRGFYTIAGAP